MNAANPAFDAVHPSGHVLFRSCHGGRLHSVALAEEAMDADADALAEAIVLTAGVSFLRAAMQVRGAIVAAGHTPSAALPTVDDLSVASEKLLAHQLQHPGRRAGC